VDGRAWLIYSGSAIGGIALGALIISQTSWWKVRMYAVKVKKIFDKHDVQKRAEAVQQLGQNPNPVLVKKPLRDLIAAYQGLIADMEALRPPKKAAEVHEATIAMHKEAHSLYQMASVGGFRQKAMMDRQKKLQQMERSLTVKMEKLYGPMKRPEEAKGLTGVILRWLNRNQQKK